MMPSEQYPRTVVAAAALGAGIAAAALTGCLTRPSVPAGGGNALPPRVLIERALPRGVSDRAGWVADIYGGFTALGIEPSPEQVCAVVAVTEQESGFRVDPEIPGLGAIAWREIDRRADHAGVPRAVVHEVLRLRSPDGQSYGERIDHARTEKELSDIFEDFTGSIPLGRAMFASWNPIHTRGPMQVNVAFAERFAELHRYPYPVRGTIADEVFTRRGSVYFGIAHLLAYQAPYDRYLYRFADYNAGQYASRNAAFQSALSTVSGMVLVADGALLPHDVESGAPGATESAARTLSGRLGIGAGAIHEALEQGRSEEFENSALYQGVRTLAVRGSGHAMAPAVLPRIELKGPKIERKLTTEWYARRVNQRFQRCLSQR
jgi:hypothetical protein